MGSVLVSNCIYFGYFHQSVFSSSPQFHPIFLSFKAGIRRGLSSRWQWYSKYWRWDWTDFTGTKHFQLIWKWYRQGWFLYFLDNGCFPSHHSKSVYRYHVFESEVMPWMKWKLSCFIYLALISLNFWSFRRKCHYVVFNQSAWFQQSFCCEFYFFGLVGLRSSHRNFKGGLLNTVLEADVLSLYRRAEN